MPTSSAPLTGYADVGSSTAGARLMRRIAWRLAAPLAAVALGAASCSPSSPSGPTQVERHHQDQPQVPASTTTLPPPGDSASGNTGAGGPGSSGTGTSVPTGPGDGASGGSGTPAGGSTPPPSTTTTHPAPAPPPPRVRHRPVSPVIRQLKYGSSPAGGTVTITGRRLQGATRVTVNGSPGIITWNTSTRITVVVPSGAVSGPVVVTTPFGTATGHGFPVFP